MSTVLFLCTGNSARSILAECLLNRLGQGLFQAFSAGSSPTGAVNPHALRLLQRYDFPTAELRSKSWDEFAGPAAPKLDYIFTVCDNAAEEVCPIWPGHPMTAHWGIPDPAGARENEVAAFEEAYVQLSDKISAFISLPFDQLTAEKLRRKLEDIGKT